MAYYCSKCKYEITKEKVPTRCPYCSTEGTIKKRESAQELLDSVMGEMDDIEFSRKQRGY